MAKKTLKSLLGWAFTRAYIEIHVYGEAEVQMNRDDFATCYTGDTLYQALNRAYKTEQALKEK